jgi:hypothetical protein
VLSARLAMISEPGTFEAAPAASYAPHEIHTFSTPNDPHDVLSPVAQKKWTALVQRAADLHAAIPMGETVRAAAEAVTAIERRIRDLTRDRAEGGFGLDPDNAPQVEERRKLERAVAERDRQRTLYEVRGARWNTCAQLRGAVSDWLLRGGIPHGCVIESVEDAPLSELLKKGEHVADAVERYRHRLREFGADLHRLRSAPWPSSVQKEKAKAQVEQWASAPDFDSMIEHNSKLTFPMLSLSSFVRGTETPALAFTETTDTLGLFCWLFKDQLLAKINAGLDEAADDKAALSQAQREEMEAQISSDVLAVERAEVACIWAAEAQNNEIIDFRADTSPQGLLGLRLVNRPRASPSGTSPEHAWDIVGGRRRQIVLPGRLAACVLPGMHGRGTGPFVGSRSAPPLSEPRRRVMSC